MILKPSKFSPACLQLMADLIPKYLDPDTIAIMNGAVAETTWLLKLHFKHIFHTSSYSACCIITAMAAKYMTPLMLELGGKLSVFVDVVNTNLEIAVRHILWGKIQNQSGEVFYQGQLPD